MVTMKNVMITFLLVTLILSGCSLSEENNNYTIITGYIIDKEEGRLLVVEGLDESEFDIHEQTVEEILKIADPNATWVSIGDNRENDYSVGEQVKVTIDGGVNTSYPAQASAKHIEVVE
ncbi:Protein of unknown function [Paenibacillus sp. 453mf]|nr:Protein of unknown function [Paenibacillus sp. 453mf]